MALCSVFCGTCGLLLTSECKMHDTLNSVYCKIMKPNGAMKAHVYGREGEEVEKKFWCNDYRTKHLSQVSL